jgi:hypothetical protein
MTRSKIPPHPRRPTPPRASADLEFEITQQIDSPFADPVHQRDEPTLSKLDFEDLEPGPDL